MLPINKSLSPQLPAASAWRPLHATHCLRNHAKAALFGAFQLVQPPRAARRCCAAPPAAHWRYGAEEVRRGAAHHALLTESSVVHANASSAESGGGCCQHLRDALLQAGLTGAAASAGRGRSIRPRGAAAWPSAVSQPAEAAEKFIW
eukprot:COSAG06_NODE_824_length_12073_cov_102.305161_10_plen_147_part_00